MYLTTTFEALYGTENGSGSSPASEPISTTFPERASIMWGATAPGVDRLEIRCSWLKAEEV